MNDYIVAYSMLNAAPNLFIFLQVFISSTLIECDHIVVSSRGPDDGEQCWPPAP